MSVLPELLIDRPNSFSMTIALAHGAGAPMDSKFMSFFAQSLSLRGFRVVRFEFPFMSNRRITKIKKPPDKSQTLEDTWRAVIYHLGSKNLIIGGKSMGGRIASMVADDTSVKGLICLGYPFHPTGQPHKTRVKHLAQISTPTLICQGTRDALGKKIEVANYILSPAIRLYWVEDGDHNLCLRKNSGHTEESSWSRVIDAIENFSCSKC